MVANAHQEVISGFRQYQDTQVQTSSELQLAVERPQAESAMSVRLSNGALKFKDGRTHTVALLGGQVFVAALEAGPDKDHSPGFHSLSLPAVLSLRMAARYPIPPPPTSSGSTPHSSTA